MDVSSPYPPLCAIHIGYSLGFVGFLSPRKYDVIYKLWDKLNFRILSNLKKVQVQVFEVDMTWLLESGVDWHLAHSSAGILWLSIVSEMRSCY